MKLKGLLSVLLLSLLGLVSSARSGGAQAGGLQCLRASRTTDFVVCLSCHDGSLAQNLKLSSATATAANPCGEHPVPVNYAEAYARQPTEFVAPGLLDPQILLINGQVQCITCHTPDASGNWVPLKGLGARPLCLSCHRK